MNPEVERLVAAISAAADAQAEAAALASRVSFGRYGSDYDEAAHRRHLRAAVVAQDQVRSLALELAALADGGAR